MKKAFKLIIVIIVSAFLAACQPTPHDKSVANKGDGELEKKMMQTAEPETQPKESSPEKWQEELEYQSGVQVVIDAEIKVPDTGAYPVVKAVPHEFRTQEAQKYVDILMQGQSIYKADNTKTKEDYTEDIVKLKAEIESVKQQTGLPEWQQEADLSDLNQQLQSLQEQYEAAPDKAPEREPAAVEFTGNQIEVEADLGKEKSASLGIYRTDDNIGNAIIFINNGGTGFGTGYEARDTLAGLEVSQNDALESAKGLLQELGITEMELAKVETGVDEAALTGKERDALLDDPGTKKCYIFRFSRSVNGVPTTLAEACYGIQGEDDGSYSSMWGPEYIEMYVDDSGVLIFSWFNLGDLGETINENVQLTDFEEIKEIFKKQMFFHKSWVVPQQEDNTIIIKEIKLGVMRVKLVDNSYAMLPVWDFIGDWTSVYNGEKNGQYGMSFLTINAIDGSVIDRNLGY